MKEKLKTLIANNDLESISDALMAMTKVGIQIIQQPELEVKLGSSRLGGLPDVASDFVWPLYDGRLLSFLAQINCAEVAQHDPERIFPNSGLLHFFYDIETQPWGFTPNDKGSGIVTYTPNSPLVQAEAPVNFSPQLVLPMKSVGFKTILTLPSPVKAVYDLLSNANEDHLAYINLHDDYIKEVFGQQPQHQLLGNSSNIQGEMELECQLVSNGLNYGDPSVYDSPQAEQFKPGAADWRLLLQFDSDNDLNVMWGDCGMVYFWIREQDLQQSNFSRMWTILQCG
jgi:uncharacterized protein YwqG